MKPAFESVSSSTNASFLVREFRERSFSAPYHFHPEYELTLIVKGTGIRYVGTHMQDYAPGDLVLLGGNLPHCWKTGQLPAEDSVSVVLHFREDFLGSEFFQKPEMNRILQLLHNSHAGLKFTGGMQAVKRQIQELPSEKDHFKKLITMLNVLNALAASGAYDILHRQQAYSSLSAAEIERINKVIAYIMDNFQKNVSLKEAACRANMTTHAFCKYFKRITRKTFVEAVNDYRIDFAMKQLVLTDKSIANVGFDSGFNDISNFHKTFKARVNLSPLSYRNRFMQSGFSDQVV